jgi:hypothetical protein
VHGARARVDRYGVHAAVVADDPDLVHRTVALLDRLRAHDAPRITALRELDRLGARLDPPGGGCAATAPAKPNDAAANAASARRVLRIGFASVTSMFPCLSASHTLG